MSIRLTPHVFAGLMLASLLTGCLNPQTTRLPMVSGDPMNNPRLERRGLEFHDPYPSRTMGPDTFTRPQGYNDQRSDTRRIQEAQILRSLPRDGNTVNPPGPITQYNYPGIVRD